MPEIYLALIAMMVTVYIVLDGFDFGAGTLSLLVARTDDERRAVISAIGPFWDGNEVWLIASGGMLMAAFPAALAAAFSGLYLAMFLVVWALILRGITIEMLMHMKDRVGRARSVRSWWVLIRLACQRPRAARAGRRSRRRPSRCRRARSRTARR